MRVRPDKALHLVSALQGVAWRRRPLLASLAGWLLPSGGGARWATVPGQWRSPSADPFTRHVEVAMVQDDEHPVRLPSSLDQDKLAEAALALLSLTVHEGRVWKALDWDLMNLLHRKGWISDPVSKAKSVVLTEEGEALAGEFLRKHFGRGGT